MEFLNALVWTVLVVAIFYGSLNIIFICKASYTETASGAPAVWFVRFVKSVGVATVSILWLLFG